MVVVVDSVHCADGGDYGDGFGAKVDVVVVGLVLEIVLVNVVKWALKHVCK
jgi:hypothetical protein